MKKNFLVGLLILIVLVIPLQKVEANSIKKFLSEYKYWIIGTTALSIGGYYIYDAYNSGYTIVSVNTSTKLKIIPKNIFEVDKNIISSEISNREIYFDFLKSEYKDFKILNYENEIYFVVICKNGKEIVVGKANKKRELFIYDLKNNVIFSGYFNVINNELIIDVLFWVNGKEIAKIEFKGNISFDFILKNLISTNDYLKEFLGINFFK